MGAAANLRKRWITTGRQSAGWSFRMRIAAVLALVAVLGRANGPAFDVVSVKVSEVPTNGMSGYIGIREGGSIALRNVTLHFLVGMAYALPDYRISGGPRWI